MLGIKSNIDQVKGIGPKRKELFNDLGITRVEDALLHFPRDYIDLSPLNFKQGKEGVTGAFPCLVIGSSIGRRARSGVYYTKVPISDGKNRGYAIFFNQPYISRLIHKGNRLLLIGQIKKTGGGYEFPNPQWLKFEKNKPMDLDPITPIYPLTEGLTQNIIRKTVKTILEEIGPLEDIIPEEIRKRYDLISFDEAVRNIHYPKNFELLNKARYRIAFEELLVFQLMIGQSRDKIKSMKRKNFYTEIDLNEFVDLLPFQLTKGQKKVIDEICEDVRSVKNMNRLIQGDVGSGKTVVACSALYLAAKNGLQGVLMAPTEILAVQHHETLKQFFEPLNIKVELLTGATGENLRQAILGRIKSGKTDVVVGTHALLQGDVDFRKLGMVVTDEQHRFGVKQRQALVEKGHHPDVLIMSATPIPRTVALTLYGDLDISTVDTLPEGRQEIKTYLVNREMRKRVYDFLAKEVGKGHLAYVVCPALEENEYNLANVEELSKTLQDHYPDLVIKTLHGKMEPLEKESLINSFMNGDTQVLVSTTVVEVGVDVPRATLMIVEDAERFGLAQLHQIRGRVGRGGLKSYCILISDSQQKSARSRLSYLMNCHDGFEIAQRDLELRGPGEFIGTKQHGFFKFKMASFLKDVKILEETKKLSDIILKKGYLSLPEYQGLYKKIFSD